MNNGLPFKPIADVLFGLCRCWCSPENHENPFIADGELHRKADYIIQNSTISRRRIRIADPDCTPPPPALLPEPPRDAGLLSADPGDIELIMDVVNRSPSLERSNGDLAGPEDSEDHDETDRQRQQTPSPVAVMPASDIDLDGKAETSTTDSDRLTTSLLHGAAPDCSNKAPDDHCHCCAVQWHARAQDVYWFNPLTPTVAIWVQL